MIGKGSLEWNHPKGEDRYTLAISVFRLPDWVTFYELLLFLDRVRPRPKKKRLAGQPENSTGERVQLLILG